MSTCPAAISANDNMIATIPVPNLASASMSIRIGIKAWGGRRPQARYHHQCAGGYLRQQRQQGRHRPHRVPGQPGVGQAVEIGHAMTARPSIFVVCSLRIARNRLRLSNTFFRRFLLRFFAFFPVNNSLRIARIFLRGFFRSRSLFVALSGRLASLNEYGALQQFGSLRQRGTLARDGSRRNLYAG